ncbi:MAG: BolA family transcriptional regulator [Alphaproteobacteria bacterium]|nr:BolA family transcriptional regulator [Alphaproteobacteria bacterium]
MGEIADRLRRKLEAAFDPQRLEIVDDSHRHAGHAGARPEGETHFNVTIVSAVFAGVGRVERQRKVYAAVADEMRDRVHALQLRTLAPDEDRPARA